MIAASQPFPNDLTSIDWSSSGSFLVAGDRLGHVYSVDPKTLKQMGTAKAFLADKKNAWVEDIKIAPNESMIAFGTHGGLSRIDLVKVLDNGRKLQPFKAVNLAISSALTHLDFS